MSTVSLVRERLDEPRKITLRTALKIGVVIFVLAWGSGRLQSVSAGSNNMLTSRIENISAVFLDDPRTENLERWAVVDAVTDFDPEDGVLFLTIKGELDGPFFELKVPDK